MVIAASAAAARRALSSAPSSFFFLMRIRFLSGLASLLMSCMRPFGGVRSRNLSVNETFPFLTWCPGFRTASL